ncbi:MAG: class I SAM-dependent methyltransferase [Patescibacteria group bacterium]
MFSDPTKIVEQCGIQAGQEIAEFGSGSGLYSMQASRALMSSGRVYAIDVQKDLLAKLKNESVKNGLYNIEVIWGNIEKLGGTKLRDRSIDFVFLCNTLFQTEDREGTVKEAKRVLKPGGKVVLVDWAESFGGIGPAVGHVFSKLDAEELFQKQGFHNEKEIQAGSHHYGFIFKKM